MLTSEELRRLERLLPLRPHPWRVGDIYAVILTNVIGFSFIVVAWYGAHNATDPDTHALFMNLAVAGLIVALGGHIVWFLTGLREVGILRRNLLGITLAEEPLPLAQRASVATGTEGTLVAAKDMTRYHRPDCLLVAGKAVTTRTERQHVAAGRRACGVCHPDEVAA